MNVSVLTFSPRVTRSSLPIPEDLVLEIFSRLPSKAIARCCCVSKLWSSMLRSQYFTESFLTKSSARPQLLFSFEDDREIIFFSSPHPENPEENSYVVAANHLACFPRSYGFFGCTSGFFAYGATRIFDLTKSGKNPVYVPVICNPKTGQSLTLPRLKSRKIFGRESYFGYDPISKEFKVLSVGDGWISKEHHVLTLGTKKLSWRMVECSIPHLPSRKWICISGVIYYVAKASRSSVNSMVVCFDLRSEKFSFVKFSKAMPGSTTLVKYIDKVGLLMSGDSDDVTRSSTSFELWVLRDAAKQEWSKHVYVLPPSWEDVVAETMRIAGMVGVNEVVLAPWFQNVPSYHVIYYNVDRKTIRKVRVQGLEAFHGKRFNTYLNYVENVELI
ncbi:hypothetical protein Bca52824_028547 [Brassica carinata]|uniref:F-box domain-containing protein n=1 Tax=Brassica carinata TaxID=52824 RepID=A0A8X8AN01_BRACI|nr:hypothetical protein Bca52824_028547 [Brassica carinata]